MTAHTQSPRRAASVPPVGSASVAACAQRAAAPRPPRGAAARTWWPVAGLSLVGIVALLTAVWLSLAGTQAPTGLLLVDGELEVPAAAAQRVDAPTLTGPTTVDTAMSGARVEIPALNLVASIGADLTLGEAGDWVPPLHELGRWAPSADLAADAGVTMLAGHVWANQDPGVLADLHTIGLGHLIRVIDAEDLAQEFLVASIQEVPRTELPGWVWGSSSGERGVVLVTCAGRATGPDGHRVWSRNLIITAIPIN